MLDQNTDRMWYVIGAVIVGAAIIFLANGTLPSLFASVMDTFDESSGRATHVVDTMGMDREVDDVLTLDDMLPWAPNQQTERVSPTAIKLTSDSQGRAGLYFPANLFEQGVRYALTFNMTKLSGEILGIGGHLHVGSNVTTYINGSPASQWKRIPGLVESANQWSSPRDYPNDTRTHYIEVRFTVSENTITSDDNIYIQPNRMGYSEERAFEALIENVVLYRYVES